MNQMTVMFVNLLFLLLLTPLLTGCGEAEQDDPAAIIAEGEKAIAEAEKRIAKAEAATAIAKAEAEKAKAEGATAKGATAKAGAEAAAEAAEKDPVKQLEQLATALKRRRQVTLDHDSETKVVLTAQYYKADTPATLKGHTLGVNSVSFSPDGKRIASESSDSFFGRKVADTIRWLDASTGEELHTLEYYADYVNSLSFSPDGTRFVLGTGTGPPASLDALAGDDLDLPVYLAVYAVSTGEGLHTFKGHTDGVNSVSFSPDGTRIASGSSDQTIRLWDASTGEELQTLKGHTSGVSIVAFSPNGKRIVSGGRDKTLKVWDAPHELVDRQLIDVGTWGKTLSRVLSVEFDVRKTDSLVSPFTGYITVKSEQIPFVNAKGETEFQTEAEARAANRHKPVVTIEDRFRGESGTFHFAY